MGLIRVTFKVAGIFPNRKLILQKFVKASK